ncbi:MAG TPA: protease inhibitor I42 family protein [Ktedonobacteraceae bacterium]|jgi:inhibitor of cysteine peptidase|nr:protease inhibitor I42 family protein [Ktedonobacteraceae bacterium]
MRQYNESSNGQEIDLQTGQKFEVRLRENPTTGFRWNVLSGGEPTCKTLADVYEPPDSGLHGQEGTRYWRFEAVQAGYAHIELLYRRSWESAGNAARRFILNVRVNM